MGGTGDTMSIDDATPEEWNKVTKELRKDKPLHIYGDEIMDEVPNFTKLREDKTYGDDVDSPFHYNKGNIECIDAIKAASTKEEFEGYIRANVLKYVWRFRYKDNIKDLRKAKWYLDKLIESLMASED